MSERISCSFVSNESNLYHSSNYSLATNDNWSLITNWNEHITLSSIEHVKPLTSVYNLGSEAIPTGMGFHSHFLLLCSLPSTPTCVHKLVYWIFLLKIGKNFIKVNIRKLRPSIASLIRRPVIVEACFNELHKTDRLFNWTCSHWNYVWLFLVTRNDEHDIFWQVTISRICYQKLHQNSQPPCSAQGHIPLLQSAPLFPRNKPWIHYG